MKYKIKVGNKYLVGESYTRTIKGTVRGDTTAVYSRNVGEQSAYDFTDDIDKATEYDRVTACDYVAGIMDRQRNGHYLGVIKLFDSDEAEAEQTHWVSVEQPPTERDFYFTHWMPIEPPQEV